VAHVTRQMPQRIEQYFDRFLKHHLCQKIYTDEPSLFFLIRETSLLYAAIRFLFFSHPDLHAEPELSTERADEHIVRVVQSVCRYIAQDAPVLKAINREMNAHQFENLTDITHLFAV
jgi:hypothetical protein